jgi:hypothetical protein
MTKMMRVTAFSGSSTLEIIQSKRVGWCGVQTFNHERGSASKSVVVYSYHTQLGWRRDRSYSKKYRPSQQESASYDYCFVNFITQDPWALVNVKSPNP